MNIAVLTNILTPYRVYFFDTLSKVSNERNDNFKVFVMTEGLPLYPWNYEQLKRDYTRLMPGKKIFIKNEDYLFNSSVVKEIDHFSPDVLVVAGSWTYPTVWQTMLSKKITKKCQMLFWTESHNHTGINNSSKVNPLVKMVKSYIFNKFDGFCLPGKYAKETLESVIDIKNKSIVRLPNLVDNPFYAQAITMRENKDALREELAVDQDAFVFFTPARLSEVKGQVPFFTNLDPKRFPKKTLFVLAGQGEDKERIQSIATEKNINIRILDYQNQNDVLKWLSLSDAFLLPSLSDPNPLAVIEASWAGLPLCVSVCVGNNPELVEEGKNGVVFDTLSAESVNEKIGFILSQSDEWLCSAGQLSHKKAAAEFETRLETEKFVDALEKIVNGENNE